MSALQKFIELGDANRFDEMSTAEFVIYTEWITGGKIYNDFLDEAAAEIQAFRAALAKSDPWTADFHCIHCGEEYFLLANEHRLVHKPDCIYLAAVTAVQS